MTNCSATGAKVRGLFLPIFEASLVYLLCSTLILDSSLLGISLALSRQRGNTLHINVKSLLCHFHKLFPQHLSTRGGIITKCYR